MCPCKSRVTASFHIELLHSAWAQTPQVKVSILWFVHFGIYICGHMQHLGTMMMSNYPNWYLGYVGNIFPSNPKVLHSSLWQMTFSTHDTVSTWAQPCVKSSVDLSKAASSQTRTCMIPLTHVSATCTDGLKLNNQEQVDPTLCFAFNTLCIFFI